MRKEELLKFYLSYRLYIFPIIIALSSIILIVFVIFPQTIKLLTNQNAREEIIKKSKFLEAKAQTLEGYDTQDLNLKVNYALNAYPADKDFASAIGLLQNLTSQLGFNIATLTLGAGSGINVSTQSYTIRLELLGSISLLPTLLNNIENSSRLMRVSGLEIINTKDVKSAVALNIDILYSAAPGNFGSIDSPLPELSKKEEEVLVRLARVSGPLPVAPSQSQAPTQLGPRGKANPFE